MTNRLIWKRFDPVPGAARLQPAKRLPYNPLLQRKDQIIDADQIVSRRWVLTVTVHVNRWDPAAKATWPKLREINRDGIGVVAVKRLAKDV